MKLDRLETHDRLLHFKKDQAANLFAGVDECARLNKDCVSMQDYFPWVYIFSHPRTHDDGVTQRMIHLPRLLKPKAQTNSYLFRLTSKTDIVEVIWLLPPPEMWSQYDKGNVTESEDVRVSIDNFLYHRDELESAHKDDWPEDKIQKKLQWIAGTTGKKKWMMI